MKYGAVTGLAGLYELPLNPLFETNSLMGALYPVVKEIYSQHVQPVHRSAELKLDEIDL